MVKNLLQNGCEFQNSSPVSNTAAVTNPFGTVLVRRQIASNSGAIYFNGLANYPYNSYTLLISNFTFSSGSPYLLLNVSTDNGNTYPTTGYASQLCLITTGSASNPTSGNGGCFCSTNFPSSVIRSGEYTLWNVNSPGNYFSMHGLGVANQGIGAILESFISTYLGSTAAVNAFSLSASGGIGMNGIFSLYGLT